MGKEEEVRIIILKQALLKVFFLQISKNSTVNRCFILLAKGGELFSVICHSMAKKKHPDDDEVVI